MKFILSKFFWGFLRHFLSDKNYAKFRYWLELDKSLDLENPCSFTEKIQYIKLYQRTELRRIFANRIKVRDYVMNKIGGQHLIPMYGNYKEIDPETWESLPSQFVLKANHGSGMVEIIKSKTSTDYNDVRQKTELWKKTDYYTVGREWVYKDLPRTILAEKLLLDNKNTIPKDYKFFCFQGEVKVIQVDINRFGNHKRNLYDRNFNQLKAKLLYPNFENSLRKPKHLDKAINIAEILSSEINFIRVDLYLTGDNIFFGELTNYPENGFVVFEPAEFEYRLGNNLSLY